MAVATPDQLTISDVASETGLTNHTLRYYERAGLLNGVGRNDSGHRRYTSADVEWVVLVTRLRATGMPIRKIRRYAELVRAGEGNEAERVEILGTPRRGRGEDRRTRAQPRADRLQARALPRVRQPRQQGLNAQRVRANAGGDGGRRNHDGADPRTPQAPCS